MQDKQSEALELADMLDAAGLPRGGAILRTQHAAIQRKDALLRKLIAALDSDRHDIDDWPPESCEAVYDIRQELSQ